jgi:hypothetical protein
MTRKGLTAILFGLLVFGGCDTGTVQRLNCICLIDYSGSLSQETLHLYVETIRSDVLARLGERDRLVVLPIDEGAKTKAVNLVSQDLAEKKFLYHSDGYAHAQDSLRLRLARYAEDMGPRVEARLLGEKEVRQKYTYKTDIFAAIEQAAALMEHNENETTWDKISHFITGKKRVESTNTLMIFSDMIQESGMASFADSQGVSQALADSALAALESSHHLPDLSNVTVFVNGRTGRTNEQVDTIQDFWLRYFKAAHANLAAYEYDARSQIKSFLSKRLQSI